MAESGRLEAIWIKRFKRGPMDETDRATLVAGRGIEGNANQGGKRQVTILSKDVWDEMMSEVGADLDPTARRANLLVSGLELRDSRNRTMTIGKVRIRIHGETRPCERMEEAAAGLQSAMGDGWRGGVFGEVLDDGTVGLGDPVEWRDS